MQLNSYAYLLLLLPVAVGVFWALPQPLRRAHVLAVSLAFYGIWNPLFLLLPLAIAGATWLVARLILAEPARARSFTGAGIALVLAVLAFFKYRGFFLDGLAALAAAAHLSWPRTGTAALLLPLGVSFYSFEAISYLIDVRQKRLARVDFVDLCLFILFWPHLLAGPIVRARELLPQLSFERKFEVDFFLGGMDRIVWGLVKKNFVANNLSGWVDNGFLPGVARLNSSVDDWFLAVAFGLQIYFDFSAYSDIAIGSAQLLGVRLPDNFRFPYHAANPADFWARWHMTLSRWVRDYLFFPMNARFGGSPGRLYPSLLLVMGLVGLWHGAGWGFIAWGAMHGGYLVLYRIYESVERSGRGPRWIYALLKLGWRPFTLVAVAAAWVVFRAPTIGLAGAMLRTMFVRPSLGLSLPINFYLVTVAVALLVAVEPLIARAVAWYEARVARGPLAAIGNLYLARPLAYALGLLLFLIFDDRDTRFIYFQF